MRSRWSRSSARTGYWSIGCWRPGCGCWPCIPIRSRPLGIGFAPRAASQIGLIAFVLCELARTDAHRFRILEPDSDQTKALRALTRAREDLVNARVAMSNQLHAELERFWPGADRSVQRSDQPDLTRIPGALSQPPRRPPARREAPGGVPEGQPLQQPHRPRRGCSSGCAQAPTGRADEIETLARRQIVLGARARRCRQWSPRSPSSTPRSPSALEAHPDGEIFRSFFRSRDVGHLRRDAAGRDRRLPRPLPRTATRSPPTPAKPPSPSSPANARPRPSAGRATNAYAKR